MKCKKRNLLEALQIASRVSRLALSKNRQNCLLDAANDQVVVSTGEMEVSLPLEIDGSDSWCIHPARLQAIVNAIEGDEVEIVPTPDDKKNGLLQEETASVGNYHGLYVHNPAKFLRMDPVDTTKSVKVPRNALRKILPAISRNRNKIPVKVQGIFLDASQGNVVATDEHRMHIASAPGIQDNLFIPADAIDLIYGTGIGGNVIEFQYDDELSQAIVSGVAGTLITEIEERQGLDYSSITTPHPETEQFSINLDDIAPVLKQVRVLVSKDEKYITLTIGDGNIEVEMLNPDLAKYENTHVPIKGGSDVPTKFHFVADQFYDAIRTADGEITVEYYNKITPFIIKHGDLTAALMPCTQ